LQPLRSAFFIAGALISPWPEGACEKLRRVSVDHPPLKGAREEFELQNPFPISPRAFAPESRWAKVTVPLAKIAIKAINTVKTVALFNVADMTLTSWKLHDLRSRWRIDFDMRKGIELKSKKTKKCARKERNGV
jgi:hypothetical protein